MYAVDSHAIMMKDKAGMMTPHFGQESLMVYTTHKCTLSDHVAQLTKVKNKNVDCVSIQLFVLACFVSWNLFVCFFHVLLICGFSSDILPFIL